DSRSARCRGRGGPARRPHPHAQGHALAQRGDGGHPRARGSAATDTGICCTDMTLPADIEISKATASAWFRQLRDEICARLEALEREVEGPHGDSAPGHFEREPWQRTDHAGGEGGGGEMSMLHGRVF